MPMMNEALQGTPDAPEKGNGAAKKQPGLFDTLAATYDADYFLYSGTIDRNLVDKFIDQAEDINRRTNVSVVLCTLGGDAHAAYIFARYLKDRYKKLTLYIFGRCKSAGTLVALGADEIVMSYRGELGPLDIQMLKPDELIFRSSGLDILQAITSLSDQAFQVFEKHFLGLLRRGGGAITTKTAADIASSIAVGLIAPVTGQIDPWRVGEIQRANNIGIQYGITLNGNEERVRALVNNYPSHSSVIEYNEAKELFGNVRRPDGLEARLEYVLRSFEKSQKDSYIKSPNDDGIVMYLSPQKENDDDQTTDNDMQTGHESEQSGVGDSGSASNHN